MSAALGVTRMDNEWWKPLATGAGFGAATGAAFALFRMIAKAVSWLVERGDKRLREERTSLETFRTFLDGKAKEYRVEIEAEVAEIKQLAKDLATQNTALKAEMGKLKRLWMDTRGILLEVTVELQDRSPEGSDILVRARQHLEQRYPGFYEPIEEDLPVDIAFQVRRLTEKDKP